MNNSAPFVVIPHLIVGLGNPGSNYERTRHNVGFRVVDALARRWGINFTEKKSFQAQLGEGYAPNRSKIYLLKPLTYMNSSGQSVRAVLDWFKLSPKSVLVIYDDIDLPMGKIRIRLSGSSGGQKGMKSVITHLGSEEIPRIRVGIGVPIGNKTGDRDTPSYVLGEFTKQEQPVVEAMIHQAAIATECSLTEGIEKTMGRYNNSTVTPH
ncbi:MAG: aminoacyl-tRNA hydrolase [Synechococcales bacterium]|nr:aminoacyl-tRNA hydrolase [Cyanobacteria bacterium REEB444]MEB3126358.1 aminoacyl-tRNA hydrolase [Synechococcales bacterium]NBO30115.1 aminoacyl-tRNA hydrolase [Cyanobacteria bacterium WB6_1B_304]